MKKELFDLINKNSNNADYTHWKPILYNLNIEKNLSELKNLLLENPEIVVHDEIENQLRELIKSKNPSIKFSEDGLKKAIEEYISPTPMIEYGLWAYYPWSKKLVHILNKDEYIFARTSRNVYKITPQERDILAGKKIGVIGLSVGQSVSLALAMERICGEIRLTDFDILELTNLNRIRTGIHNIGLKKVYAVAREIAEIDPYIEVKCFEKGLSEDNMDEFFCEGGKLDLLIEESDGFDIKILSRYKARELGIPVLMEASDKCMVDVERFDTEPDRPILHGLVKHLDIATLKNLKTTEDKIPYMLDILGIETCSPRLKASMLEIEQSINTWPQLASAVIMGGGITADVARRMLLNQFKSSGRYYVDIEELIGDDKGEEIKIENKIENIQRGVSNDFSNLNDEQKIIKEIVQAACLAPSGGNSQPWLWEYNDKTLYLISPFDGENVLLGHGNRSLLVAQGCALENLKIVSSKYNLHPEITLFPENNDLNKIAKIEFKPQENIENNEDKHLSDFLKIRQTNRYNGKRVEILDKTIEYITKEIGKYNSKIHIYKSENELDQISEILSELEKIRTLDSWGSKDFVNEIRWTDKEAQSKLDGIELESIHLTEAEKAGLIVSKSQTVISLIKEWDKGDAFKKLTKKTLDSASCICVLTMPDWTELDFLNAGSVLENMWVRANSINISFQPISASVFLYYRLMNDKINLNKVDNSTIVKMNELLPSYNKYFPINEFEKSIFIFRLSFSEGKTKESIRKPVEELLTFN